VVADIKVDLAPVRGLEMVAADGEGPANETGFGAQEF